MSLEYAENRIKEALKLTGGNHVKARQQIIAWTFEDPKLLHALAKPHLSGIVAYNIERVASGRAEAARTSKAEAKQNQDAPKTAANEKTQDEQFGLEILKAVAGSPQIFGLEDPGASSKSARVSQSHLDAIRAIAAKKSKSE